MSSAASLLKQFGRAWKITIANADGTVITFQSNTFVPEPLHIKFESYQTIQQAFWFCDISIYNLNSPTEQEILLQGMTVTLDAGYQSQPYGTIFQGTLFQPLWTRENGVDYKLTLRCIVGIVEVGNNFIGQTIAGGITQRQLVAQMAQACRYPLDVSNVGDLGTTQQSRSATFFGKPDDYFQNIANDTNTNLWFTNMAVNIQALRQAESVPTLSYGPGTGLIGTPVQTQDGVMMKVLLDARAVLMSQIKLDEGVVIQQLERELPSYPTILAQNGTYIIGAVRHYGDSRANDWYSEITGFVNAGTLLSLQTGF